MEKNYSEKEFKWSIPAALKEVTAVAVAEEGGVLAGTEEVEQTSLRGTAPQFALHGESLLRTFPQELAGRI